MRVGMQVYPSLLVITRVVMLAITLVSMYVSMRVSYHVSSV